MKVYWVPSTQVPKASFNTLLRHQRVMDRERKRKSTFGKSLLKSQKQSKYARLQSTGVEHLISAILNWNQ